MHNININNNDNSTNSTNLSTISYIANEKKEGIVIDKDLFFYLIFYMSIGCISLFGYSLIARTVYKHVSLNYAPYHLLLNLGVCDIGYSLIGMVLTLISAGLEEPRFITYAQILSRISFIASVFSISCLAFDRLLSMKYLLKYQFFARRKISLHMIALSWGCGILCNVIIMVLEYSTTASNHGVPIRRTPFIVIPVIITANCTFIVCTLVYIRRETRFKMERLRNLTRYLYGVNAEQFYSLKRRQKFNYDITVVTVFQIATLVPVNIIFLIVFFQTPASTYDGLLFLNWTLGAIYCAINPFVYLRSIKKLRFFFIIDSAVMQRLRQYNRRKCNRRIEPYIPSPDPERFSFGTDDTDSRRSIFSTTSGGNSRVMVGNMT